MAGGVLAPIPRKNMANIIAVGSGKGGVGKSTVAALIASELVRDGKVVGILDADITGPSIPKLFGVTGQLVDAGQGIEPMMAGPDIRMVSSQLLIDDESKPIIWRGPLVTRLITQFFGEVNWGSLDYLLIDMPPGTSDVPLTVFQTIPIYGMVFVSTPQDLSSVIVQKAVNMAKELHMNLIGVIENMAVAKCPSCGHTFELYGKSHTHEMVEKHDIPFLGQLPVDPRLSELGDEGNIDKFTSPLVHSIVEKMTDSIRDLKSRKLRMA
jgi:Mrp family chromosome partitioning ATPase